MSLFNDQISLSMLKHSFTNRWGIILLFVTLSIMFSIYSMSTSCWFSGFPERCSFISYFWASVIIIVCKLLVTETGISDFRYSTWSFLSYLMAWSCSSKAFFISQNLISMPFTSYANFLFRSSSELFTFTDLRWESIPNIYLSSFFGFFCLCDCDLCLLSTFMFRLIYWFHSFLSRRFWGSNL